MKRLIFKNIKKISLFFFFLFFITSLNTFAQSKWIEKKINLGNFYIKFPSQPTYSAKSFHGWMAKDRNDQVTYMVIYVAAPANEELSISLVEEFLLPSMLEGDIEVSKDYLKFYGFDAIDFIYRTKQSPFLFKKGRAIVRDRKLYVLQVHYYHSDLEDFNKFASSLMFF